MRKSIQSSKNDISGNSCNKSNSNLKISNEINVKDKLITNFFKKDININLHEECIINDNSIFGENSKIDESCKSSDLVKLNVNIEKVINSSNISKSNHNSISEQNKCINNTKSIIENIGEINNSNISIKPPINKSNFSLKTILNQEMSESKDSKLLNKKRKNSEHTKCKSLIIKASEVLSKLSKKDEIEIKPVSKRKENRNSCNICKDGGDLLLCDGCPKSFHQRCLLIKELDPNSEWYCTTCSEKRERRKKLEESKKNITSKSKKKKTSSLSAKKKLKKKASTNSNKKVHKSSTNNYININVVVNAGDDNLKQESIIKSLGNLMAGAKGNNNDTTVNEQIESLNKLKKAQTKNNKEEFKHVVDFSGDKLTELGLKEPFIEKSFEELNDLNYIIEEVIKKDKLDDFISSYLIKAKEENDPLRFKENFALKKKAVKSDQNSASKLLSGSSKKKRISAKKKKSNKKSKKKSTISTNQTNLKNGFLKSLDSTEEGKTNREKAMLESIKRKKEEAIKKAEELRKKEEEKKYLNVKYPIEDEDLFENWKKYKLEEMYLNKPAPNKLIFNQDLFLKMTKIHDFALSFSKLLKVSTDFTIEMLYFSMDSKSLPRINLFKEILFGLLSLILDELLFENVEQDFLENEDLYIFLILIFRYAKQKKEYILNFTFIKVIDIFLQLEKYQIYSDLFVNLKGIFKNKLIGITSSEDFFILLNVTEKISLMEFLITLAFSTDSIRNQISSDITTKSDLKKEKQNIELDFKEHDARKKELERMEKQIKPKEKIEALNKRLENLAIENEHLGRKEIMKMRREIETERDELKSILKEKDDIEVKKNKITVKIEKINSDIDLLSVNSKKLIGVDGLGNSYYIFRDKNNTIRIHVKQMIKNKKNISYEWGYYGTYSEISNLVMCLTDKGKNEKALAERIRSLNVKLISAGGIEEENEETICKSLDIWVNSANVSFHKNKDLYLKENYLSIAKNIDFIKQNLKTIGESFSDKLEKENKNWEKPQVIQEFYSYVKNVNKPETFKDLLLLMNNCFKTCFYTTLWNSIKNDKKALKNYASKIILDDDDEKENMFEGVIDDLNNPNIEYRNKNSERDQNYKNSLVETKIWKPFEDINFEEFYLENVNNIKNHMDVSFLIMSFGGVVSKYIKERLYRFNPNADKDKDKSIDDLSLSTVDKKKNKDDFSWAEFIHDEYNSKTRNNNSSNNVSKPKKKYIVSMINFRIGMMIVWYVTKQDTLCAVKIVLMLHILNV